MSTATWQEIPYSVEVLMKIAPRRVLDANLDAGRWGMLVREFCEAWHGRILPGEWAVHLEGIGPATDGDAVPIAAALYNRIHPGDAAETLPTLPGDWDLLILDDVLERLERPAAEDLLAAAMERAAYVLVNVSLASEWPQNEADGRLDPQRRSAWAEADFARFALVRRARFLDYLGRPYAVFVLSQQDPQGLKAGLFSSAPIPGVQDGAGSDSTAVYLQALERRNQALEQRNQALEGYNQDLRQYNQFLLANLDEIKGTRAFYIIDRLRHSPASGLLLRLAHLILPRPGEQPPAPQESRPARALRRRPAPAAPAIAAPAPRTEADRAWLEQYRLDPRPLSVNHPQWRGILASARQLFDSVYLLPDDLDEAKAAYYARLFCDARPPSITIQGFPQTYYHLIQALHALEPRLPVYLIWHGNFLQLRQDYDWDSFRLLKTLAEEGALAKLGFMKMGMAEVLRQTGLPAHFLTNVVRTIPEQASTPRAGGPHIGVWAEPDYGWNKLPYAMLSALSLLPEAQALVVNVSERAQAFGDWFHLAADYHTRAIPNDAVLETLPQMHLNLNVSLSECAPMLPLESLAQGAPCLLGPSSHYFLDDAYLHSRLVVPYADNSLELARYIRRALDERDAIVRAYAAYAPEYNRRAFQMLAEFLEYPPGGAA